MNSEERRLLEKIKNYTLIEDEIMRLRDRLKEENYKVIATYESTGGGSTSNRASKVETMGIRVMELEQQIREKQEILRSIYDAVNNAGLNKRERDLIICTIKGYSLSGYARQKNIYKTHVYKIRDTALRKMLAYLKAQNV